MMSESRYSLNRSRLFIISRVHGCHRVNGNDTEVIHRVRAQMFGNLRSTSIEFYLMNSWMKLGVDMSVAFSSLVKLVWESLL